jgi:hypothetical protein
MSTEDYWGWWRVGLDILTNEDRWFLREMEHCRIVWMDGKRWFPLPHKRVLVSPDAKTTDLNPDSWFAIKLRLAWRTGSDRCSVAPQPPLNAQFLLDLFLSDDVCEAFLGDLQERYSKKLPRLGKQRADWWYRKQVLTSLWPLARSFGRRVSLGFVWRIAAFVLRLIGFPVLADALRRAAEEERKRVS